MNVTAIIPARYASTRLPGKPLIELAGKPMILHVCDAVSRSRNIEQTVVATDHESIADIVRKHGFDAVMTPSDLPSGSDRVAAAVSELGITTPVLNVQGDEPMISPEVIDRLVNAFIGSGCDCATPVARITSTGELVDTAIPKVVMRKDRTALYFSRAHIPFLRDHEVSLWLEKGVFYRHVGLYLYQPKSLQQFVASPPSDLEQLEQLEQLRMLDLGMSILCVEVTYNGEAVDVPEDVQRVEALIKKQESAQS